MSPLLGQQHPSNNDNNNETLVEKSPQADRAEQRALRKRIPESQPPGNAKKKSLHHELNADTARKQTANSIEKTRRQRANERAKTAKRSRKSSSPKKNKEDITLVDEESSNDFEDPPRRSKGKKKTSVPTRTQQHDRVAHKSKYVHNNQQVRKPIQKDKKRNRYEQNSETSGSDSDSHTSDYAAPDRSSESLHGKTMTYQPQKWQSYTKRMRRLSSNKEDQQFVSDLARLEILMRIAIHDFVPNENYKTTVMYWANQSTTAAAAMLFKRHKNDLQDYIERYETELKMLEIFGPALRQCANNERAVQTTQIRKTFMSKQNPETRMAENIIEGELDPTNHDNPPRLHKNLRHLGSIEDLRELLISPKMYQDKVLFDLFCTGIESGNFRQTKRRPYKPLQLLMTKAHEAHFRVELYFALSQKCYRHINSPALYTARICMFNQVIKSVREGREKWLEAATAARYTSLTQEQRTAFEVKNDEGNDSEENVDIDEDDL
jgi:hypothetical protein